MPTLAIVRCFLCNGLAERPCWHCTVAGQTAGGEVFHVDVPLCLECSSHSRPGSGEGEQDPNEGGPR